MNKVIRSYSLASFQKIVKIFLFLNVLMFAFCPSVVVADETVKKPSEELILNKSEAAALGLVIEKITDPSKLKSDTTHGRYSGKATADQSNAEIIFTVEVSQSATPPLSFESVTAGCSNCTYPKCRKWGSAFEKPCYSRYKNGYTNFGVSGIDRNRCGIGGKSQFSVGDYSITVTSSKLDYAMSKEVWDEMRKRHDLFVDAIVKKLGDDQRPHIRIYKIEFNDNEDLTEDSILVDAYGTGEFLEVTPDMLPIKMGANGRVITGVGITAKIDMAKRGIVIVRPLSNYAVGEFLIIDEGITAHTNMKVGEVNVKVDHKYKAIDFSVSCGAVTSSVRGTEFTVKHEESPMKTTISVHSGKVEVKPTLFLAPVKMLSGGQQITVDKDHFGAITKIGNQTQISKNTAGNLCGTDREFILSLFQSILERDPIKKEIEKQLHDLQNGISRKDMIIRFFKFGEYLHKKKGGSEVYRDAYQAVLGRESTPKEIETFPRTRPYMMAMQLLDTEEYGNLCLDKKEKEDNGSKLDVNNTMTEKEAYERYVAAYNKFTQLNAENKGDTLEAQRAFEKYKYEKERYEKILKNKKSVKDFDTDDN